MTQFIYQAAQDIFKKGHALFLLAELTRVFRFPISEGIDSAIDSITRMIRAIPVDQLTAWLANSFDSATWLKKLEYAGFACQDTEANQSELDLEKLFDELDAQICALHSATLLGIDPAVIRVQEDALGPILVEFARSAGIFARLADRVEKEYRSFQRDLETRSPSLFVTTRIHRVLLESCGRSTQLSAENPETTVTAADKAKVVNSLKEADAAIYAQFDKRFTDPEVTVEMATNQGAVDSLVCNQAIKAVETSLRLLRASVPVLKCPELLELLATIRMAESAHAALKERNKNLRMFICCSA